MINKKAAMAISLLASPWASAGTYHVGPTGNDGNNGTSSPWLTIQHAVNSVPAGDQVILLSPGTYTEGIGLDLSKKSPGNLTIGSGDPVNPAILTSTGDQMVVGVTGNLDKGSLIFREVSIIHPKTACLVRVDVQNLQLAFDRCSLIGSSAVVETAARAAGTKLEFLNCKIRAGAKALNIASAAALTLKGCELAWDDGPFIHGRPQSIILDACALEGSPTTLLLSAGGAGKPIDLIEVRRCVGSCGRLMWEQGGIRRLLIVENNIQWKHTGTVTIGMGIEVRNAQTAPVVNPAPYEKILIADNIFHFAENTTHPVFLGRGADNAEVVRNVLISPKARKYGIVLKSDHNLFEFNSIFAGTYAFYLAGGSNNRIRHNTICSDQTNAFVIDANQERTVPPAGTYGQPKQNVVEDNLFVSKTGIAFGHDVMADDDSRSWNNSINRNLYWSKSAGAVACLNGVSISRENGLGALQAQWRQYGADGTMKGNDEDSIVADPLLANPPEDFSLAADSPARRGNGNAGAGAATGKAK